ncbi:hypothetical protein CANCADRAFT_32126 [Tortispora caseinolytica NRRL Y-17796]|uniref:Peptidase S64 n=1 Tax=Tortispora caseinolytica NRRL Y-17796 TaxID=767744 RepID=A0A1E4T9V6_9ASCO|nr:hypothetical protein CANCADRAFT_32126 [Tortispora caseinolytica NRRL Y-17796]
MSVFSVPSLTESAFTASTASTDALSRLTGASSIPSEYTTDRLTMYKAKVRKLGKPLKAALGSKPRERRSGSTPISYAQFPFTPTWPDRVDSNAKAMQYGTPGSIVEHHQQLREALTYLAGEISAEYQLYRVNHKNAISSAFVIAKFIKESLSIPAIQFLYLTPLMRSLTLDDLPELMQILKISLHLCDNVLVPDANSPIAPAPPGELGAAQNDNEMNNAKSTLMFATSNLGLKLGLVPQNRNSLPYPTNFPASSYVPLQSEDEEPSACSLAWNRVLEVVDSLVNDPRTKDMLDREGAYLAPVCRGFSPSFCIPTVVFGIPSDAKTSPHETLGLRPPENLPSYCREQIEVLTELVSTVHFMCRHDSIIEGAMSHRGSHSSGKSGKSNRSNSTHSIKIGSVLKTPFRVPSDLERPPMSVSLSVDVAETISGTFGGYIRPVSDSKDKNKDGISNVYAMSCAHVCLTESYGTKKPRIAVPSTVLINMYRETLFRESQRYTSDSRQAEVYKKAIQELDGFFPRQAATGRNTPHTTFGEVLWGERRPVNGTMIDLAVIQCNTTKEVANTLGDDIDFTEYDPNLMFDGTVVKNVASVNPSSPNYIGAGAQVFKYGSTSKYTSGRINGPRVVYWANGELKTSEFVVAAPQPLFASGGDSGAWILHSNEDTSAAPGLSVVGMLHAYDGEFREFGLFTPMEVLLDRLAEVTNTKWEVIGASS